ncbi:MAG: hypothetical protein AB1758_19450 [Candidatus Eremiobacterota bacterium]
MKVQSAQPNPVDVIRLTLADREQEGRLLQRLAERYDAKAEKRIQESQEIISRVHRLDVRRGRTVALGMGLIVPTVASLPLATSIHPVCLLLGVAAGAGVLWSLREHGRLTDRMDDLDRASQAVEIARLQDLQRAYDLRMAHRGLWPQVEQLRRELAEARQVEGMLQGAPPAGGIETRDGLVIVGGVRVDGRRRT